MNGQRGSGKFEFAVVLIVFGVLAAALMVRLGDMQAEAERIEVDLTLRNIRVGLQLAIGECIMRGEEFRIASVAEANPFDFLDRKPRGFTNQAQAREEGQWAYDAGSRTVTYFPRLPAAFGGVSELRWRFVARVDANGRPIGASLDGVN